LIGSTPDTLLESFCGVGNPFSLSPIGVGDVVLDIGCGAGLDLAVASRLVEETGRVYGVDLTPEMVARARTNLAGMGVKNGEVILVSSERLPFVHDFFDVVISNGVINLSPDKPRLFSEIFRVLKPGGRLQFIDIVLEKELPSHLAAGVESWAQ
jgi:ubiquinone/menaquinone biosynthesis C-methylase UbiE